jgi:aryl carrier-like protein
VLELAVVDPRRNFFDLGGTSVHAIVLHTKLRERLPACEFSVMTIFQHPTIAEFLEAIAPATGGAAATATAAGDRAGVGRPAAPGVRGNAPSLSAAERAERQRQRMAGGQPPWAVARN